MLIRLLVLQALTGQLSVTESVYYFGGILAMICGAQWLSLHLLLLTIWGLKRLIFTLTWMR